MSDAAKFIRKKLRQAREEAGLSQYQLADRFHTTQSSISGLERGRVDITAVQLIEIASILGKPVIYFLPKESEEAPHERDLLAMFRSLPQESQEGFFAMISAQYKLIQEAAQIERLPKEEREAAAMDAFAQYLVQQGLKLTIDEAGYPVLDGGDIKAIMETMSEEDQKILVESIRRMQTKK